MTAVESSPVLLSMEIMFNYSWHIHTVLWHEHARECGTCVATGDWPNPLPTVTKQVQRDQKNTKKKKKQKYAICVQYLMCSFRKPNSIYKHAYLGVLFDCTMKMVAIVVVRTKRGESSLSEAYTSESVPCLAVQSHLFVGWARQCHSRRLQIKSKVRVPAWLYVSDMLMLCFYMIAPEMFRTHLTYDN